MSMEVIVMSVAVTACSIMNYLMPKRGVLSLHSGCNIGKKGDVTLFFGLSGKWGHKCPQAVAW